MAEVVGRGRQQGGLAYGASDPRPHRISPAKAALSEGGRAPPLIRGGEYLVGLWDSARRYGVTWGGNAHGFRVVVAPLPEPAPLKQPKKD